MMADVKREVDLLANYCAQLEMQLTESERRRYTHKRAAIAFKREAARAKAQVQQLRRRYEQQ